MKIFRRPSNKKQHKNRMENFLQIIFILMLSTCSAHNDCIYNDVTILNQQNKTLPFNETSYNCKCVALDNEETSYFMCSSNNEKNVILNMIIIQNQQLFKTLLNDSSRNSLLQEKDVQLSNNSMVNADDPGNGSVSNSNEIASYKRDVSFPTHKNVSQVTDTPYFNEKIEDNASGSNVSNGNNLEITNDTAENILGNSIVNIIKKEQEILNASVNTKNQNLVHLPSNVNSSFSKNNTENMTGENDYENFKETPIKNIVISSDGSTIRKSRRKVNDSNTVDRENVSNDPNSTNVDEGQNISMTQGIKDTQQKYNTPSETSTIINFIEFKAESSQESLTDLNTKGDMLNKTSINENISNELDPLDQQTANDIVKNDCAIAVTKSKDKRVKGFQNTGRNATELSNSSDADEIHYYNNQPTITLSNKTNEDGNNSLVNRTNFSPNNIVAEHKNSSLMSNLNLIGKRSKKILSIEETTQENHPKLMIHNNVSSTAADNVSFGNITI